MKDHPSAAARFLLRWTAIATARPWVTILVGVLLAALGGAYAATHLGVNTDTRKMLNQSLDFNVADRAMEAAFPKLSKAIAVVVRAPTPELADAYARELEQRLRLEKHAIAGVISPSTDPYLRRNAFLLMSSEKAAKRLDTLSSASTLLESVTTEASLPSIVGALAKAQDLSSSAGGQIDTAQLKHATDAVTETIDARLQGNPRPMSWQSLLDTQPAPFAQRVLTIEAVQDFHALHPARAALTSIRDAIGQLKGRAEFRGVQVGVTGDPALREEELKSVTDGMVLSFGLSFVLLAVVLGFALRSGWMAAAAMLSLSIGIALTSGFAALAVESLNLVSVAFTVLMFGLGIDFALHYCLHVQKEESEGKALDAALSATARHLGPTLLVAAGTASIGFLAFVPTNFIGIAQLGVISGAGVLIALACNLTILPAALRLVRRAGGHSHFVSAASLHGHWKRRPWQLWVVVGVTALALPLLPHVRFNADPMGLRDPDTASVKTFAWLYDGDDGGPYRLSVVVKDAAEAQALTGKLKALPQVGRVVSTLSFVPDDQEDRLGLIAFAAGGLEGVLAPKPDKPLTLAPLQRVAAARSQLLNLPRNPELDRLSAAIQQLQVRAARDPALVSAVERDLFAYLPPLVTELRGQLSPEVLTVQSTPQWIKDRFIATDGRLRLEIQPAGNIDSVPARRAFVEAVQSVAPTASGPARSVLEAGGYVAGSMIQATSLAFVLAIGVVWITTRKFSLALIVVTPLVFAAILTSAAGVLLDLPYNYANVIVLPLLIGLSVDAGIYLTVAGSEPGSIGKGPDRTTARSILFSALTTMDSFGTLSLSDHRGIASMGILLAIGVAFAVITTMTIIPNLLALRYRHLKTGVS